MAAAVRRWSGAEARALRIALRFSVRRFAEYLGIAPRTISKWESAGAGYTPRPDTQSILDMALTRADENARERFEMLCRSQNDVGQPAVNRRSFNTSLLRAGVALGVGTAVPASEREPVDPTLIGYFESQIAGHYVADMLLGPAALLDTVSSQLDLIIDLLGDAGRDVRRPLARIGAAYSAFLAWLRLDAGELRAAFSAHELALELAHRSCDPEAIACALVDRAMAFTDLGNGDAVVDLCESALLHSPRLSAELQVFAMQQQAHGQSLLGDRREVDRILDDAVRLVDRVDVERWGTACKRTAGYIEVQRATCYGRLGLSAAADDLWNEIIPTAPDAARRDVGVWSARQSVAALGRDEPERALALARRSMEIAAATGSARARRALVDVNAALEPWRTQPVGREFRALLAPVTTMNDSTLRRSGST